MSNAEQESREVPQSLAPIQVERTTDPDLAGMRGHRGVKITIAVLVFAAAIGGGAQLLRMMDARQAYATAAAQLDRSESEQGDAFIRCALPHQQRGNLTVPTALHGAIEIATERMGKTYAKVLTTCTPLLESFQQSISGIKAPPDVTPKVAAVSKAANDFGAAWLGLRDHLQRAGEADRAETAPLIDKITATWQTYQTERERAKQALSAQL